MKNKDNIIIKNMPLFGTWLVVTYGSLVKVKNESGVPNAQVILRSLELVNHVWHPTTRDIIVYIPVTELDIVRIGSVWKYQKLVYRWTDYGYLNYKSANVFHFDLTNANNMEVIQYNDYIHDLKSSIRDIYTVNLGVNDKRSHIINKSLYTKLIDQNDNILLIPSLELFTSIYTPYHKEIRAKLLQQDTDSSINKYINIDESYFDCVESKYFISLNDIMLDDNIIFIAYAKFNHTTRQRLTKLWNSLEYDTGDKDCSYSVRYPYVLPFNPSDLQLKCDGIWLNDKIFLALRISTRSLPRDLSICVIVKNINTNVTNKIVAPKVQNNNKTEQQKQHINIHNLDTDFIDSEYNPAQRNTTQYIKSEVGIIGLKPKIDYKVKTRKLETIEYEIDESLPTSGHMINSEVVPNIEDINIQQLSGAEENSSKNSKQTVKIAITDALNNESAELFNNVLNTLESLKTNSGYKIKSFSILDENLKPSEMKKTNFYNTLKLHGKVYTNKDSWLKLKKRDNKQLLCIGYRPYILIKIEITKDYKCYLLEIGKKDSEHFLGLIFYVGVNKKLTLDNFIKLLQEIVIKKGTHLVQHLSSINSEIRYYSYIHRYDKKSSKQTNLLSTITKKLKLIKL